MLKKTALLMVIIALLAGVVHSDAEAASPTTGAAALAPEALNKLPVVPTLSANALAIYRRGTGPGE